MSILLSNRSFMNPFRHRMEKVKEYWLEVGCSLGLSALAVQLISDWQKTQSSHEVPIHGLTNFSSFCYMNSLLQMLATMPEYVDTLKKHDKPLTKTLFSILSRINTKTRGGGHFDGAAELVNAIRKNRSVLHSWRFVGEQQDCSEFWQKLNHILEEEQRKKKSISFNNLHRKERKCQSWSTIYPHRFTTIRKMTCTACKFAKEDRLERHEILSLNNFPGRRRGAFLTDFEVSLDEYFGRETLNVTCEKCNETKDAKGDSVMTDSVWSSPESIRTSTPSFMSQHEKVN